MSSPKSMQIFPHQEKEEKKKTKKSKGLRSSLDQVCSGCRCQEQQSRRLAGERWAGSSAAAPHEGPQPSSKWALPHCPQSCVSQGVGGAGGGQRMAFFSLSFSRLTSRMHEVWFACPQKQRGSRNPVSALAPTSSPTPPVAPSQGGSLRVNCREAEVVARGPEQHRSGQKNVLAPVPGTSVQPLGRAHLVKSVDFGVNCVWNLVPPVTSWDLPKPRSPLLQNKGVAPPSPGQQAGMASACHTPALSGALRRGALW